MAAARYEEGSTLRYSELVVWVAVRHGWRVGALITHIYVDDAVSMRGGREIWGLPKELARFAWERDGLCMTIGGVEHVRVDFASPRRGLPLPVLVPAWSAPGGRPTPFLALGTMRARLLPARVHVGEAAPFRDFGLGRVYASFGGPCVDLRVLAPRAQPSG